MIKLYAWEPSFEKKVSAVRDKEMSAVRKAWYLRAVQMFGFTALPFVVSIHVKVISVRSAWWIILVANCSTLYTLGVYYNGARHAGRRLGDNVTRLTNRNHVGTRRNVAGTWPWHPDEAWDSNSKMILIIKCDMSTFYKFICDVRKAVGDTATRLFSF